MANPWAGVFAQASELVGSLRATSARSAQIVNESLRLRRQSAQLRARTSGLASPPSGDAEP
jgi:hypothetical protein